MKSLRPPTIPTVKDVRKVLALCAIVILSSISVLNLVVPLYADSPPPNWYQVNQDGFGYGPSFVSDRNGTILFVFDGDLFAFNENGLFRMEDPQTKNWTQLAPQASPAGPGIAPTSFKPFGDYLYAWDSGQLWWAAKGTDLNSSWNYVTSLGLPGGISPEPMTIFNGEIYGVYENSSSGTFEIWRTGDIGKTSANWEQVVMNSFGDPANNRGVDVMIVFNGKIYAGTTTLHGNFGTPSDYGSGVEVWESPAGDSGTWTQVNVDGFGTIYQGCSLGACNFAIHQVIGSACVYQAPGEAQEYLYIGTKTHVWGAEVWRYDGSGVGGWENVTQPWAGPGPFSTPGRNSSMAVFEGNLYLAEGFPTANLAKYNGNSWTKVVNGPNPFDRENGGLNSLATLNGEIYVSTLPALEGTKGDQVWGYFPPLTVISPNGGENWKRGSTQTISWSYLGDPGPNVTIELLKGGTLKSTIASSTSSSGGNGSYYWHMPFNQATGSDYQIRITSTTDSSITDTSDGNFTIYAAPKIKVKKPNGGEVWEAGTTQIVEWAYAGPTPDVKIELLQKKKGHGNFWTIVKRSTIATDVGPKSTGLYKWAIPSDQSPSNYYFIAVTSTTNSSCKDISDNPFSITAPTSPSITVTAPNGGETMQAGWEGYYNMNIQWKFTGDPGSNVKIELLKGGVVDSTVAASLPVGNGGAGSYYWVIPATQAPGSNYRIRITSTSNSSYTDTSDGDFTITAAPTITVNSPNGNESWQAGTTQTIQWAYGGNPVTAFPFDSIKIELLKGGTVDSTIAAKVSVGSGGSGLYAWVIPSNQAPGTGYRIKVTFLYYSQVTDTSDADFSITSPVVPTVKVTSPNGGETWQAGTTQTIQWSYTGNPGPSVTIDLLKGGAASSNIATNVSIGSGGVGSCSWAIPANQAAGTDYQVKVTTSLGNVAYTDTSDAYFSITASAGPSITVISPNGGENWQAGSTYTISWSYTGDPGPNLNIKLYKGGTLSYLIVAGISKNNNGIGSNGSIQWTIPTSLVSGSDYRVKITSTVNSSWTDTSDGDFTITNSTPPSITVVVPNGGESWSRGTTHVITWTYTGDPGPSVKIEGVLFTTTHPATPFTVVASTSIGSSGVGSYNWAIPSSLSTGSTYQITITSTTNSSYTDTSDGFFSIVP